MVETGCLTAYHKHGSDDQKLSLSQPFYTTSLLVQDACAHDQVKCLSAAQLREASLVCHTLGFLSVKSLRQAHRENCHVQENLQLLEWSLMFPALQLFSFCT
jgi:hypothetical protein